MNDAVTRYRLKAAIMVSAWQTLFNKVPTKHAVLLTMSVAEFETRLGDAGHSTGDRSWLGEHNWGAVQKRALTKDEAATLAAHNIHASDGEDAVMAARALLPAGTNECLHRDTSPLVGAYFKWFWCYPSDVEAAKKFLTVLVSNRPKVAALIDTGSPTDLARAMYESKYYEGTHKGDPEANIRDYAAAVARKMLGIELALAGWEPLAASVDTLLAAAGVKAPAAASNAVPFGAELAPAIVQAASHTSAFGWVLGGGGVLVMLGLAVAVSGPRKRKR